MASFSFSSFLLRGLSIYRWNNFPRIAETTALDHASFSLHAAFLVADLVEEVSEERFDRLAMFRRSLFSVGFSSTYSDVNSDVKSRIKRLRPDLYRELCTKMHRRMLAFSMPEGVRSDLAAFASELEREERTPEADLFSYGKLVSAYYEAHFNARVYPETYALPLAAIRERLYAPRFARFRQALDVERDAPPLRFLLAVRRLQSSFRWNRLRRDYPVSVMSHLYLVAAISYMLARMEGHSDAQTAEIVVKALSHDVPEAITGDIITPTKKAVDGLEETLAEIEREAVRENLIVHLAGRSFATRYAERMLDPWSDRFGPLVKQADLLSAYLEARLEELRGENEQFRKSREYVADRIRNGRCDPAKRLLEDFEAGFSTYLPDSIPDPDAQR